MTLLCKQLPSTVTRLNIAGCRKTMTDESKYHRVMRSNSPVAGYRMKSPPCKEDEKAEIYVPNTRVFAK